MRTFVALIATVTLLSPPLTTEKIVQVGGNSYTLYIYIHHFPSLNLLLKQGFTTVVSLFQTETSLVHNNTLEPYRDHIILTSSYYKLVSHVVIS